MVPGGSEERFEIVSRLGSGSFGIVYEAFDRYRFRSVALKVLERVLPDSVARFKREFRYLADIRHPNLVSLYELLKVDDRWAFSMELIRGSELLEHLVIAELQNSFVEARTATDSAFDADQTLRWRPKRRVRGVSPLYFDLVRATFRQLALAIAVLHAHGILHRDIKPTNIMITEGRVVLLDFGLVVEIEREDSIDRDRMVGTPGYMAPELISTSTATVASDWYSFGVLLYQALTGQMPFTASSPLEVLERQVQIDPPPASDRLSGIPADLASLADDCIRRDPQRRPNVSDVLRRLDVVTFDVGRTERTRTRRQKLIGRNSELRTLSSWVDAVEPGNPTVIALHGSPGCGKSALLDLILDRARAQMNAFIVGGECQIWESIPFNAVDVIIDSLARELRRERSPAVREAMSRAVAVTQIFPTLPPIGQPVMEDKTIVLPPTGERLIAVAASELRNVLLAAAGDRPLLMVVDNAQWGDYQSADIIRRLLLPVEEKRVMLLLIYRSEDWRSSLLLQSFVGSGMAMRDFPLKELTRATTQRLVESVTGHRRKKSIDELFRSTGGNAALIEIASEAMGTRADDLSLLGRAIVTRLATLSASAYRLFTHLITEGPCYEWEAAEALELVEIDEPVRTLRNERLIRVLKTGELRALDVYHPRMRAAIRHE